MKRQYLFALMFTVTIPDIGSTTDSYQDTECSEFRSDQLPYACKNTVQSVYVNPGDNLVLNCTCFSEYNGQWVGPNKIHVPNVGRFIPYAQGMDLNPRLNKSKYRVIGGYHIHKCNLQIRNFLSDDDGEYNCRYVNSSTVYIDVFNVRAKHMSTEKSIAKSTETEKYLFATKHISTEKSIAKSTETEIYLFATKQSSCISEKFYNSVVWKIIGSLFGGSLILSICFNIYCLLKRKRNSEMVPEIPLEVQYYGIGTIYDNSESIEAEANNVQESVISVERPASERTNSFLSSFEKESSSGSSIQILSNSLLNEDGYENPYQMIDPENIEMHPYSIVTSKLYQNTIIFQKEIINNNAKHDIQNNEERGPWLIIYKNECIALT